MPQPMRVWAMGPPPTRSAPVADDTRGLPSCACSSVGATWTVRIRNMRGIGPACPLARQTLRYRSNLPAHDVVGVEVLGDVVVVARGEFDRRVAVDGGPDRRIRLLETAWGVGSASSNWKYLPWKVTSSWVQAIFTTSSTSSEIAARW